MFLTQLSSQTSKLKLRMSRPIVIAPVCYYTFLDESMDYYTAINSNFIALTHKHQYFVLVSGQKDGKPYSDFLKTILGPNTVYIESDQNKMTRKFNLFREYLITHRDQYYNYVFCKIDTDLVHYNSDKFQQTISEIFSNKKNVYVGVESTAFLDGKYLKYVRGGLNAIHYESIIKCPRLPEDYKPFEFDIIFSNKLMECGVQLHHLKTFSENPQLDLGKYATHIVKGIVKKDKQVNGFLQQLSEKNIAI